MNEGLEKLKEIHELVTYPLTENSIAKIKDNVAIIEKELIDGEKNKQALEIIKHFIKSKSLGLTFIFLDDEKKILTVGGDEFECWYKCEAQEEYGSLKKVLL